MKVRDLKSQCRGQILGYWSWQRFFDCDKKAPTDDLQFIHMSDFGH